ncbi:MAG TPA: radical SAM protein, partial [Candidatus Omnitrophica bacterium]|nr:radical SAM protein [Candidatus Omnitrophota bacterium]
DLVKDIADRSKNINWIRLLYLNPKRVDDKLIKLIKDNDKVCKYIDLPIQHINNRILKLMNRNNAKHEIISLIKHIRKEIPEVTIRTSVIVGFPTETDTEFEELLDFIREIRFERLGAFIYSHEEGTPAYDFSGQIDEAVKQKRFDALMQEQLSISGEVNRDKIGKIIDVLIEKEEEGCVPLSPEARYVGRSHADAPEVDGCVFVKSDDKLSCGDIVKVKVIKSYEYDLVGEKASS